MSSVVAGWPIWIAGMNNEQVIGAHTRPGQGLFVAVLQQQLAKRGVAVRFDEYDFASRSEPWHATSFTQPIAAGTSADLAAR